MCIGIPGQICAIDGNLAKVEVCGIQREVDLTLVGAVDDRGQPRLGQWVLVQDATRGAACCWLSCRVLVSFITASG